MYKIQTNNSGTRHIDVSEENLQTIDGKFRDIFRIITIIW
jgi:hypothetical protein